MSNWATFTLGQLLQRSEESALLRPDDHYNEVTIRLWGKGVISRGKVRGSDVGTKRRFVRAGQLILSKIDARNGALGIVPCELDGAIVSSDFPSFDFQNEDNCLPAYLGALVRSPSFVKLCKASSEGTTNRVRLKEERFLAQEILLPPVAEQRAIVTRLDALIDKTRQVAVHLDAVEAKAEQLLAQQFHHAIANAPYRPVSEVAPLVRREVEISPEASYPELGIRSFGKGAFHKPAISGMSLGTKRLFRIEPGDLVFSNVFAWEGAIAVARPEDKGRFGSHRFMTCVVNTRVIETSFLLYYLLSSEGLEKVRAASPGGAGRNRTLGVEKLANIEVPVPSRDTQHAFTRLQASVAALKAKHAAIRESNAALVPAVLERVFTG